MIQLNGIIGEEITLLSLIEEVKKEEGDLVISINSLGGDGEMGFQMYDFLKSLEKPITTIAQGNCASAATLVFMAGTTRIAECPLMIHNPWLGVEGDADELERASSYLKSFEKRGEKFYSTITGLPEGTISDLMKKETYISPAQAVSLGFATEYKSQPIFMLNLKNEKMDEKTLKDIFGTFLSEIKALIVPVKEVVEEVKMLEITDVTGEVLKIEREEGDPQVGDVASPDGTYVMTDGTKIVVLDGVITEIIPMEVTEPTPNEEVEQLKAEIEALKQQLSEKETKMEADEQIINQVSMLGGIDKLKTIASTYKPQARKVEEKTEKKTVEEIKNEIKTKLGGK